MCKQMNTPWKIYRFSWRRQLANFHQRSSRSKWDHWEHAIKSNEARLAENRRRCRLQQDAWHSNGTDSWSDRLEMGDKVEAASRWRLKLFSCFRYYFRLNCDIRLYQNLYSAVQYYSAWLVTPRMGTADKIRFAAEDVRTEKKQDELLGVNNPVNYTTDLKFILHTT